MSRYRLFEEWDENTEITWWNEGRKRLNTVIKMVNTWQLEHDFDHAEGLKVQAFVDLGKRSWAAQDGGEVWLEVLTEIEQFVRLNSKDA